MPFVYVEDQSQRIWKPNQRQADFIKIPDSVREGLYGGAAGGGKSEVGIVLPVVKGWINLEGFRGVIFRRTFPQLEESLIPRAKQIYGALGATYNATKHEFTFPQSGSTNPAVIKLDYMLTDDDARSKDTVEYNYAFFDELTHFGEFQYKYITFSRVRGDIRVVRAGTNPGNEGHVWVRDRFVDPAPEGYMVLRDPRGLMRIFIPSRVEDNDWLMEHDPDYINALHQLPEAEKRAKLYGDWYVFAGQVFTEYRQQLTANNDEPDYAHHLIHPFEIPAWWPKIASIDWGYTAYTDILWAAISPDERLIVYREYHERQKDIADWASTFKILSTGDNLLGVTIDPSAKGRRGDPKTLIAQFEQHSGYKAHPADQDRISGKMLVHEYLRWKHKPRYVPPEGFNEERYLKIWRVAGDQAAEGYRKLFEPAKLETNLPKLQLFNNLPALPRAISLARYDEKNPEDVAEWDPSFELETLKQPGDDPYDNLRYLLKYADRLLKEGSIAAESKKDVNDAIKNLERTGDQTSFHLRMAKIEQDRKRSLQPAKLKHRKVWRVH